MIIVVCSRQETRALRNQRIHEVSEDCALAPEGILFKKYVCEICHCTLITHCKHTKHFHLSKFIFVNKKSPPFHTLPVVCLVGYHLLGKVDFKYDKPQVYNGSV